MTVPNWKDKTILIVEDDEISMEFLSELLLPTEIKMLKAINGEQALEVFKSSPDINLVLMDVRLPKINGQQAMLEIKKQNPNLVIIAQTAFAMSGDREKYLELGFDNYLSKPIIMEELFEIIASYFN